MNQRTMKIFQECAPVFSMLSDGNRQNILVLLFDNGNHYPVKKIASYYQFHRKGCMK